MKKTIEEVVNKWKNDLDKQVDKFEVTAEKLKNFELKFLNNFESICSLHEIYNGMKEQSERTIKNLQDIEREEDAILEQMSQMEKHIDQYLEVAERSNLGLQVQDEGDFIYSTANELVKTVDEVQKEIDEINSKIQPLQQGGVNEDLTKVTFESPNLRENITLDKNEFTAILNAYYNSLTNIQFMEQNLVSRIAIVEAEINEVKREKERERNRGYY